MTRPRDEGAPPAPHPPLPERLAPGSAGLPRCHGDCCSPASAGEAGRWGEDRGQEMG